MGEKVRQGADLEHWAAFHDSFETMCRHIREVGTGQHGEPPATIVALSGDVHHAYLAEVAYRRGTGMRSQVWQAVCSPFRNPLDHNERRMMRFGASRARHAAIARLLARGARVAPPSVRWRYVHDEPWFDNQVGDADPRGPQATFKREVRARRPPRTGDLSLEQVFEHGSANPRLLGNLRHASASGGMIGQERTFWKGDAPLDPNRRRAAAGGQAGPPTAFREFYDRYAVWMRAWLLRQTGSESAALDLTAETFAQAWHASRRFKDMADGSGAPWLFGIARNLVRQYHKHNRIETAARERLGLPLAFAECEDYERVDERITAHAMGPALKLAMRALPTDQRRALELRVIEQLDYEEVAGRLGCSQNAARLRVSRGLRALTLSIRGAEA